MSSEGVPSLITAVEITPHPEQGGEGVPVRVQPLYCSGPVVGVYIEEEVFYPFKCDGEQLQIAMIHEVAMDTWAATLKSGGDIGCDPGPVF